MFGSGRNREKQIPESFDILAALDQVCTDDGGRFAAN